MKPTKEQLLSSIAEFSWSFGNKWFVETIFGNYVWSDPDYNGDNTFKPYNGNLADFCEEEYIPFCRGKGNHIIREYCGNEIVVS